MQTKVEKYIYLIKENNYRIKFTKVSKKKELYFHFDEYFNCSLEEAIKIRDKELNKIESEISSSKQEKQIDERFIVDKYIYEVKEGKKYRISIKQGDSKYHSEMFEGTLGQARKRRDIILAELTLNIHKTTKKQSGITFGEFADIYFEEYVKPELSPPTFKNDKNNLKRYLLPEIKDKDLSEIDVLTVQKIVNKLRNTYKIKPNKDGIREKISPTTVNGIFRLFRKMMNKAVDWGYIETNPVLKVKTPGVSKKEKETYNRQKLMEVLDILKTEDPITEVMYTLAICTGLRRGEIVGLHVEDIDLIKNKVYVKRTAVWDETKKLTIEKTTKTADGIRSVPIPLFCSEAIKEYLKLRERIVDRFKRIYGNSYKESNNLFLGKYGTILHPDTLSKKWLTFRENHPEISQDVTLHGLRHSYCTMQMNENHNVSNPTVKKVMGHSKLETTLIYVHANEDQSEEVVSIFDKYYIHNNEKIIDINQMLSLYFKKNFTTTKEQTELLNDIVLKDTDINNKYKIVKEYIGRKYPFMNNIDISSLNINNIWDWLEEQKNQYGNQFILSVIK